MRAPTCDKKIYSQYLYVMIAVIQIWPITTVNCYITQLLQISRHRVKKRKPKRNIFSNLHWRKRLLLMWYTMHFLPVHSSPVGGSFISLCRGAQIYGPETIRLYICFSASALYQHQCSLCKEANRIYFLKQFIQRVSGCYPSVGRPLFTGCICIYWGIPTFV